MTDETVALSPTMAAGRYRLDRRIATGGMGEVWKATDTVLERDVAIKLLKQEYADDAVFRSRFEAEGRHAAALIHPNVASVLDFGECRSEDGSGVSRPFLVMELVPGQPLSDLLRGGEPMPPDVAANLVAQAADALEAAHALDIVHRDVKPANLLVTPNRTVKITDFGIARALGGAALTQTGQLVGTPFYMAPEQTEGRPATRASDIYALGVVLYECLAGRRPFLGDTPVSTALAHLHEPVPPLPDHVPAHLQTIVDKALAKDPAQRFSSGAELAAALRGAPLEAMAGAGPADAGAGETRVMSMPPVLPPAGPAAPGGAGQSRRGDRRPLPPWLPWAAAAVGVLVVILLVSLATGGTARDDTASSDSGVDETSAPETPQPTPKDRSTPEPAKKPKPKPQDDRIRVRASDYIGMDHKDAKKALEELGFEVDEEKVEATSPDQEKNAVADVEPSGRVEPGSTLTLVVWEEYKEPKDDHGKQDEHGQDDEN